MPPRARTAAPSDAFHGSFDPGVTGRRTGVAPPTKVRRLSNGVEAFSDYFASPRKDPSVSPIRSPSKITNALQPNRIVQRPRKDRPDLFHEIGERGRKTGISPPKNISRDENGFEDFDNYLIKATETTNKAIAKERRRSLRRKSIAQALHARKLSTATFVDDSDDDEAFEEESLSLYTHEPLNSGEEQSARQGSAHSKQISPTEMNFQHTIPNSADQSIRTPNENHLIDFDAVPEGPIHSTTRANSLDDQPMTVQDHLDDDDDVQNSEGMVVNEYDDSSVGGDGFNSPPPQTGSANGEIENPPGLEDIMEDDEGEQEPTAGPSAHEDSVHQSELKKRRKSNHPPPLSGGPRRGARHRLPRLAHWKGEKVIYGRSLTPDGTHRVIGMIDVFRVPEEENKPFASHRTRRKGLAKVKSESVAPMESPNPDDNLDSETRPNGIIYSYTKNKDCERSIVCTRSMAKLNVEDQAGVPNSFQFQRLFKGTDFFAGGLLYIPVGGGKPLKPAKDNFYSFTVLEGVVSVHVHRTTFIVGPLGVFWIPRGNVYSIQNVGRTTAKLSFSQARRSTVDERDLDSDDLDEEEHSIDGSTSNDNQHTSNIDKNTAGDNIGHDDSAVTGETSKQSTTSKAGRPGKKDASGSKTTKATNKKKSKKPNMAPKKQNNNRKKNKQPAVEEPQEEEEEEEDREEEEEDEVAHTS